MTKSKSFRERLKNARRAERHVSVCLRGDLYAQLQVRDERLRTLELQERDRMVGNPEAIRLMEEITALSVEMAENTEDFILRAIPRHEWNALKTANPPRPDNAADARAGFNIDATMPILVPQSIVSPELTEDDWEALDAVLTDRQFNDLAQGAYDANQEEVAVPFSQAALRLQRSVFESRRPSGSGSLSNGSTDGNPEPSPVTGTTSMAGSRRPPQPRSRNGTTRNATT